MKKMANRTLNLDISKEPRFNPIIYGRVADEDMQTVTINLTKRDEILNLTDFKIMFEGLTSANTKVFDTGGIGTNATDLKKGTFTYTFPNMAFAAQGNYQKAYFSITKGKQRDTSGDFEIIVLDNADIDAAEAETIITEYNRLVTELNKIFDETTKDLDQRYKAMEAKLAELGAEIIAYQKKVQDTANTAISGINTTKDEAIKLVTDKTDEMLKKLESVDFYNKQETNSIIFDNEFSYPGNLNFVGKIVGDATVPHTYMASNETALTSVNGVWYEFNQEHINNISKLDGKLSIGSTIGGGIRQHKISYNLLKAIKDRYPNLFVLFGATSLTEEVALLRKITNSIVVNLYGFGSGKTGNDLVLKRFLNGAWEAGGVATIASTVAKLSLPTGSQNTVKLMINDDGWVHTIAYAPPSDGVIQSKVSIDYTELNYELKIKMSDIYATRYYIDHVANTVDGLADFIGGHVFDTNNPHGTTAKQVGAVASTGNETIKGVKNFSDKIIATSIDGKMVKYRYSFSGVSQVSDGKAGAFSADNMKLELIRQGDIVYAYMRCNIADTSILGNVSPKVFLVPEGFRKAADINNTIWNVPFSVAQFTAPQYLYMGLYESDGIRYWSNRVGNVYLNAFWHTDDPLPNLI